VFSYLLILLCFLLKKKKQKAVLKSISKQAVESMLSWSVTSHTELMIVKAKQIENQGELWKIIIEYTKIDIATLSRYCQLKYA
jgi:hypothetical protein